LGDQELSAPIQICATLPTEFCSYIRATFALLLYLFDWLCYLIALAFKPYGPHGASPRLGGQHEAIPSSPYRPSTAEAFVEEHRPRFFAQALESWSFDDRPQPAMFKHWFDIELSDFILDLGQCIDADNPPRG
jgi:hypothetical protein